MNMLYTDQEILTISQKIKRRVVSVVLIAIPFLVAAIVFFVMHLLATPTHPMPFSETVLKIAAVVCTVLCAFVVIFGLSFYVSPLKAYRKHMKNGLHGRTHEAVYSFSAIEPYTSVVENVSFRSLALKGEPDRHGNCDQMLYWDAEKEIPDFKEGESITFRYYDRFAVGWSR